MKQKNLLCKIKDNITVSVPVVFVYNVLSVFRFQPMALKAGLVDLWKWRVWVKQKEEALLKVILNKKRIASPFISELHFGAILDFGK